MSENIVDIESVNKAKDSVPSEYTVVGLELFFKVFADNTRLKILFALKNVELCVHDICYALSLKQSTVSQQLRYLRQMGIVKSRQVGKNVFYSLDDDHILEIIRMGLDHINEKR